MTKKAFQKIILDFYKKSGRDLPWRRDLTEYKVFVSEIMLQQTQVDRVVPKFEAFLAAFPDWQSLAEAPVSQVLSLWQGLGYNRRALNLKRAAELVSTLHKGILPQNMEELLALPGVGPYTAAAIMAFAFNQPATVIETNIRAVFIYHFFKQAKKVTDKTLLPYITKMIDEHKSREWYWALMDYGSMLKKQVGNSNIQSAHYTKQSKFEGSERQVRGEVLKYVVKSEGGVTQAQILKMVKRAPEKVLAKIEELKKEGFISQQGHKIKAVS